MNRIAMRRRTLVLSSLLALAIAGAAVAGGLPARLAGQRFAPPTAKELGLDAAQSSAYAELQARQRAFRRAAHASLGNLIADAEAELSAEQVDLAALSSEVDRTLFAIVMENRGLKSERMAFYQSLDEAQKARVHVALRQRVERMQRLHAVLGDLMIDPP